MATTNVSHEKQNYSEKVQYLYCLQDIAVEIHVQLTFIAVLNAFLSITAFFGNALVLVALRKDSSLHPPSKLLLRSLSVTDLCAGLFSEPLYVTLLATVANGHWNICRYLSVTVSATGIILSLVSLLTLTAISVESLLALLLGLRYRQVVTLKRTRMIIITFWVLPTVFETVSLFWNFPIASRWRTIVVLLCLVTSTFSYTKIFHTLRRHQSQVQHHVQQPNQTNQLNIARFRKALSTALWLQFAVIVCYLPRVVSVHFFIKTQPSSSYIVAISYTITLVFLNSSLNPILYCWRIDEVRQAMKETIRQILCCWNLVGLSNPITGLSNPITGVYWITDTEKAVAIELWSFIDAVVPQRASSVTIFCWQLVRWWLN